MTEPRVYVKHDSFVATRFRQDPPNPHERIVRLAVSLDALGIPDDRRQIIADACHELITGVSLVTGAPPFRLQRYAREEIARLSDSQLPSYLWYRYRYETYPDRKQLDSFPPLLQVEPTSICNYRCVFCYQTDVSFSKAKSEFMGHMSLDVFRQTIDQAQGQCEAVTLASRGEPMSHPKIVEILDYVRGKFLALKINTNASILDEKRIHAILQAEPSTLVFSADAAVEPEYSRFRVGGKLDKVLANVERFHDIKETQYGGSRTLTRVSGVKVEGTSGIDELEAFWGRYVDQVAFVAYNPWENVYDQPLSGVTAACTDLWRRMFVWWDGRVNPCDTDYKSALSPGTMADRSLAELWHSGEYAALRKRHLSEDRGCVAPCSQCSVV